MQRIGCRREEPCEGEAIGRVVCVVIDTGIICSQPARGTLLCSQRTLAVQPLIGFGVRAPRGLSVPDSKVSPALPLGHILALVKSG